MEQTTNGEARAKIAATDATIAAWRQYCTERHTELSRTLNDLLVKVDGMREELVEMRAEVKGRVETGRTWAMVVGAVMGTLAGIISSLIERAR